MQNAPHPPTIGALLTARACSDPGRSFTFLDDGERAESRLSYATLETRVAAVAAGLSRRTGPGGRALLLLPPGLDYTVAVLSCAAAGVIAVPGQPPEPGAAAASLAGLEHVATDCSPSLALVGAGVEAILRAMGRLPAAVEALPRVGLDELAAEGSGGRHGRPVSSDDIAVLLYTSGSTGNPKGVALSHGNLLHAARAMATDCRLGADGTVCTWVPGIHVSGLFSGIVLPLWAGADAVGFAPRAFVERPLRWLMAVDRHRATLTGAPTFAYDLLCRAVSPADAAGLDLSSLEVAVVGGEAVRGTVLDRFCERFAGNGFRASSLYAMFGLTEASMISAGSGHGVGARTEWVDRDALGEGRASPVPPGHPAARASVGSGAPLSDTEVVIVDPQTRRLRAERDVGEIWIRGGGVGRCYWGRPEASAATFAARTDRGAGPYLRTGDLGYAADGQVHVVGRLKEMIIVRGLNFYPDDLEASLRAAHPRLATARLATFATEVDGAEQLAVAVELPADAALGAAIRGAVTADHGIRLGALVHLSPGAIPVTSTGKVQRGRCAALLASGTWSGEVDAPRDERRTGRLDHADLAGLPPAAKRARVLELLRRVVSGLAGLTEPEVAPSRPLSELGLDSILVVRLSLDLADLFGVAVPAAALRGDMTAERLADLVLGAAAPAGVQAADRDLPADIQPARCRGEAPDDSETLLLTGATGFLGGYLLAQLLADTEARVCCLVRAASPEAGARRLEAKLRAIDLWNHRYADRIEALPGDLGRATLGLDADTFAALGERVSAIYHNGASVDFVAALSSLEQPNVAATLDCIRLAARGRPKALHFTSTLAVFNGRARLALERIDEAARLPDPAHLAGGYAQSKWIAESLLLQAGDRGLSTSIYRAGFIGGHSVTGAWNTEDFICRLIKGSIQLGVYPDIDMDLPFIPVDDVAHAMVALSLRRTAGGTIHHILASRPLPFRDLMQAAVDLGHRLKPIPYSRWLRLLREALPTDNDLFPVLPFLIEPGPEGETAVDLFVRHAQPPWSDAATRRRLSGTAASPGSIGPAYLQRCLRGFADAGFLPKARMVA